MRIASLLASATEMVCALGLRERLVGISHECDYPPEALDRPRLSRPRFDPTGRSSGEIDAAVRRAMEQYGSVYLVDADRLAAVCPDLILTQAVCEVCAVPTSSAQAAAASLDYEPSVLSLDAHDLAGVFRSIVEIGEATGIGERAQAYVAGLQRRVDLVRQRVAGRPRPRVLALEWLDPPYGPGHWVPEMIEMAGAEAVLGYPHRMSRQVNWSDLGQVNPDVLVVMPCGFGLDAARADASRHAERLHAVAGLAIARGCAYVVDGSSYFNRSGPRLVDGIEILGALLHRDVLPHVSLSGRAERWP
jgi:iron complex transport system substrate-binding protein